MTGSRVSSRARAMSGDIAGSPRSRPPATPAPEGGTRASRGRTRPGLQVPASRRRRAAAEAATPVSEASQRRDPRIPLNVTVSRADDVEPGRYVAVDISSGGICMRSTRKEKVGGFVALSFSLDGHDLHLYAEVIWSRTDADSIAPHLVGMKWVAPSGSAAQVIRNYIQQRLPTAPA